RMNNKGFTLIELLATIALLAVIATISFVAISGVIEQGKVRDCETLVNNIKSATSEYVSDNRYNNIFSSKVATINASDLTNGNYLKGDIINPFNKVKITPSTIKINITLNDNYTVKQVKVLNNDVEINCENGEW
ncbi:MAG: type II secretion system protein, partial [Bacilli bacterium]